MYGKPGVGGKCCFAEYEANLEYKWKLIYYLLTQPRHRIRITHRRMSNEFFLPLPGPLLGAVTVLMKNMARQQAEREATPQPMPLTEPPSAATGEGVSKYPNVPETTPHAPAPTPPGAPKAVDTNHR